mgnify:CR=1 FL=1
MAPYAHFKNKTELFQSIAADGFNALADRMEAVKKDQKASRQILDYGTEYIKFALDNAPLYRLMLSQTQIGGPENTDQADHMSDELKNASKRPYALLLDAFGELTDDKQIQNVRAQGAWSIVHGMSAFIIDGHLTIPEGMDIKTFLATASMQIPK